MDAYTAPWFCTRSIQYYAKFTRFRLRSWRPRDFFFLKSGDPPAKFSMKFLHLSNFLSFVLAFFALKCLAE